MIPTSNVLNACRIEVVCSFSFFLDEDGKGCIGLSIKEYNCNSLHLHECNAHLANMLSSHNHKEDQQTQSSHIVLVSQNCL